MSFRKSAVTCCFLSAFCIALCAQTAGVPPTLFGYRDFAQQAELDKQFLAIPDTTLLREDLKTLTAEPHVAGSRQDYATAVYVADKFKAAGLDTKIVEYTAWMNLPREVYIQAKAANGTVLMTGPIREHVSGDAYQDNPQVLPAMNGSAPSGDVTGQVVYANYGRPEDFKLLADRGVDVKGKLVLVRYGGNFRGVKVYIAQQHGAAGVIIYSDPADDGFQQGTPYPHGPWRPETAVQRGSVQYLFKYPGDATTPGIASTPNLPASKRLPLSKALNMPTIPSMPLSYHDANPILKSLGGPKVPKDWQGALPFPYHMGGTAAVTVHMRLRMNYAQRPIWDVIGRINGMQSPDEWVVAGNHRDAWVFGAVDPSSGTAAMLEAVRGIGTLLSRGWRPKRTILFCSWDAEEEGLMGSTEWAVDHAKSLARAVAYFNTDVAVSGPHFEASAVPTLKQFVREATMEVPSPRGGTLYQSWMKDQASSATAPHTGNPFNDTQTISSSGNDARVGDLGSGSDFTPFLQHLGVPSSDIGSIGPYGVYHSVFDDYAWFVMNADPTFAYEQQIARVFGLEVLHMADADVLPYDYVAYSEQILGYIEAAKARAKKAGMTKLDFDALDRAAMSFASASEAVHKRQLSLAGDLPSLNLALRAAEENLLSSRGLPGRSWYKHTIYAPGEYTGYAAVVIPGVNEAIDADNTPRAQQQIGVLAEALDRAGNTLRNASE